MGRGSSKAGGAGGSGGNPLLNSLTDNTNFRAWIRENLSNPDFKKFGQENGMEAVEDLWREKRTQEELKNIHEMSIDDAVDMVSDNVSASARSGWFRQGNSDYKPRLVNEILSNPGTLNAGLNIAYSNYKNDMSIKGEKPMPFNKWLNTPQDIYRGTTGQGTVKSDIFTAFTPDITVAARFTKSNTGQAIVNKDLSDVDMSKITKIKMKPIDTWGSYQTTGEYEWLIPSKKVRRK